MKKKTLLKGGLIGLAIILLSVLFMYLGLSWYYRGGFSYNTWINGIYCTGKSINEVNQELLQECRYEGLTITDSDGKSYHILPEDVELTFSYEDSLSLYLEKQNPYLWIDNMGAGKGKYSLQPKATYDKAAYNSLVSSFPFFQEKEESDRTVEIQKGENGYYLVNERIHVLDQKLAKELIRQAFEGFWTELSLEKAGCYRDLPLSEEMEETLLLWEKLSDYQTCGIVYQFGEEQVPLSSGIVSGFLLLDEQGNFVFDKEGNLLTDSEKVYAFVDRLADEYDTLKGTRQFSATRGEVVSVSGGIYGNKIDRKAEKAYLLEAFLEKRSEIHTPEYTQLALYQGKDDIGDTYIEVDMTEQMMYYYEKGELIIETPVVTGNTSLRRGTPEGVNYVYAKQRNRTLRGADYEAFVKYWIPVNGGIGIHDASWRGEFGGEIYKTNGSHGCINTPEDQVSRLYELVEVGTPCVIFY